jgi:hypothetical protein
MYRYCFMQMANYEERCSWTIDGPHVVVVVVIAPSCFIIALAFAKKASTIMLNQKNHIARLKSKSMLLLLLLSASSPPSCAWIASSRGIQRPGGLMIATPLESPLTQSQQGRQSRTSAQLLSSRRRDDENFEDDNCLEELENELDPERKKKMRMEIVRSLQKSFYLSPDVAITASIEPTLENGGVLHYVPLWRVQWTELPGRTNVLSVHEPMYTHMFEEIIRREKSSRYFGHLYLPSGTRNLRSPDPQHKLKTWQEQVVLPSSSSSTTPHDGGSAAVLGTLMKITDFRRMADGKLLLLVQAIERFVVTEIVQEVPYGIAHVQLLPDREEIQLPQRSQQRNEGDDSMTT